MKRQQKSKKMRNNYFIWTSNNGTKRMNKNIYGILTVQGAKDSSL